jgi:uncharacterized protein (DUF4415 family)
MSLADFMRSGPYKAAVAHARPIKGPSSEELAEMPVWTDDELVRALKPRLSRTRKTPVSVRLDQDVLEWLMSLGPGHLSRVNDICRAAMSYDARRRPQEPARGGRRPKGG